MQRASSTSPSAAVASKPKDLRDVPPKTTASAADDSIPKTTTATTAAADPIPPFPWRSVVSILLVNLSEPLAITLLFPFAPFLVADYVPADQVGVYAGLLATTYNVAGIPANLFWGRLSDRRGRKPALAACLVGTAVCLVLFGLSRSLWWAFGTRFLGGLFSGVGGVCRATMRDVTHEAHRARAFPLIGWTWSVGMFAGPMVGGLLSRPADWSPALRGTLLDASPYFLPCAATTLASVIGLVSLNLLRLPPPAAAPPAPAEPAEVKAAAEVADEEQGGGGGGGGAAAAAAAAGATAAADEGDEQLLRPGGGGGWRCRNCCGRGARARLRRKLRRACTPPVMLVAAQAMLHLIVTGMAELYPLVGALALGLTPNEIGEGLISLSITLFVTPLLYPHVQKRVGHTGCFLIGQTALIGANLAIPSLRALRDAEPALLWPGLAVVGVMRGVAGPFCFSSASMLFNNLLQGSFGAWNGIAQSCGSGARALAPTIFGSAFAAAYAADLPEHLPFLVLCATCAIACVCVMRSGADGGTCCARRRPAT